MIAAVVCLAAVAIAALVILQAPRAGCAGGLGFWVMRGLWFRIDRNWGISWRVMHSYNIFFRD